MGELLFGLSAAGYRVEGGFNGRGEPENQWTSWELAGKVPLAARAREGVWADPDRLLDVASSAGAEVLALGVEWSRIEPAPGRVDEAAVDRYASIFRSASERGVAPIGVLHDVAHPAWLGEEFWLTPGSPDRFADHVGRLVGRLGSETSCRRWVTLRQPNLVSLAGWVDGRHPPRRVGALADAWAVVDNFLTAHVLAYSAIHDVQPRADVVLGLRASSSYDWQRLMADLLCAPGLGVERGDLDAWIDARRVRHDDALAPRDLGELAWRRVASATSPFGVPGPLFPRGFRRSSPRRAVDVVYRFAAERSLAAGGSNGSFSPNGATRPTRSEGAPQSAGPAYPLDGLVVLWYPPHAEVVLRPRAPRAVPWARRPDPGALTAWCDDHVRHTPGLPLWVEDGFATRGRAARPDGWDRGPYLRAQISAVQESPVSGYLYYSSGCGGDPTWPDADFGLDHGEDPGGGRAPDGRGMATDVACFRRLVDGRRSARDQTTDPV